MRSLPRPEHRLRRRLGTLSHARGTSATEPLEELLAWITEASWGRLPSTKDAARRPLWGATHLRRGIKARESRRLRSHRLSPLAEDAAALGSSLTEGEWLSLSGGRRSRAR